jgi:hypothetical protein
MKTVDWNGLRERFGRLWNAQLDVDKKAYETKPMQWEALVGLWKLWAELLAALQAAESDLNGSTFGSLCRAETHLFGSDEITRSFLDVPLTQGTKGVLCMRCGVEACPPNWATEWIRIEVACSRYGDDQAEETGTVLLCRKCLERVKSSFASWSEPPMGGKSIDWTALRNELKEAQESDLAARRTKWLKLSMALDDVQNDPGPTALAQVSDFEYELLGNCEITGKFFPLETDE